jgi:Uncharacterized protein conserved in bacteria (DUF2252)
LRDSGIAFQNRANICMDIRQSTREYEKWMRICVPLVEGDLRDKHAKMKEDPFQFFRGSYYRWAQLWPELCPDLLNAPIVLSVGDLHVDSFGTWRDFEGRLCWGVDDFDEAWPLPYTNDLVRLAASVKIARKLGLLELRSRRTCEIILEAYQETLKQNGCPIVLAEQERQLEKLGIAALKAPIRFWDRSPCGATTNTWSQSGQSEYLGIARIVTHVTGTGRNFTGNATYRALLPDCPSSGQNASERRKPLTGGTICEEQWPSDKTEEYAYALEGPSL